MFHISRNSPLGRENLLQAANFCEKAGGLNLTIYRPTCLQAIMYSGDSTLVTITSDPSCRTRAIPKPPNRPSMV